MVFILKVDNYDTSTLLTELHANFMHAHGQRHGTALAVASRVGRLVQPSATLHAEFRTCTLYFKFVSVPVPPCD